MLIKGHGCAGACMELWNLTPEELQTVEAWRREQIRMGNWQQIKGRPHKKYENPEEST